MQPDRQGGGLAHAAHHLRRQPARRHRLFGGLAADGRARLHHPDQIVPSSASARRVAPRRCVRGVVVAGRALKPWAAIRRRGGQRGASQSGLHFEPMAGHPRALRLGRARRGAIRALVLGATRRWARCHGAARGIRFPGGGRARARVACGGRRSGGGGRCGELFRLRRPVGAAARVRGRDRGAHGGAAHPQAPGERLLPHAAGLRARLLAHRAERRGV
mmetsp:Transcript_12495/g.38618  ORF Transcript_12495/g.38618 Transcript_12495/m.38618 type:complete len:218 (+) Transcript_12495:2055-2708(+)